MDTREVLADSIMGPLARGALERVAPGLDPEEAVPPITKGLFGLPSPVAVPKLERLYFRCRHPCLTLLHVVEMQHPVLDLTSRLFYLQGHRTSSSFSEVDLPGWLFTCLQGTLNEFDVEAPAVCDQGRKQGQRPSGCVKRKNGHCMCYSPRCRFMAPIDPNGEMCSIDDEAACMSAYEKVRGSVEAGIQQLLAEREVDPERDLGPRLLGQAARFLPAFELLSPGGR